MVHGDRHVYDLPEGCDHERVIVFIQAGTERVQPLINRADNQALGDWCKVCDSHRGGLAGGLGTSGHGLAKTSHRGGRQLQPYINRGD